MTTPSDQNFLRALWEGFAGLSLVTRLILAAYLLYVPLVWIFDTYPGEITYEGSVAFTPEGSLRTVNRMHRATDDLVVAELGPEPRSLAILDLARVEGDDLEPAIVSTLTAPGHLYSAVRRDDVLHLFTEDDAGNRHIVTAPLDGREPEIREVHPSAQWPMADGTAMGHGLTNFLTREEWGLHPSSQPGVVSGPYVLLRMAHEPANAEGSFDTLPGDARDGLLVLDSDNSEPLAHLPTTHVRRVSPAPAIPGFLYLPQDYPTLLLCDEEGCRDERIDIRAETYPELWLDHRASVQRLAACTPTELYLYEGDPRVEAIVYLGRAPLPDRCTSLTVLDARRVLVTFETAGPLVVRMQDEAADG